MMGGVGCDYIVYSDDLPCKRMTGWTKNAKRKQKKRSADGCVSTVRCNEKNAGDSWLMPVFFSFFRGAQFT